MKTSLLFPRTYRTASMDHDFANGILGKYGFSRSAYLGRFALIFRDPELGDSEQETEGSTNLYQLLVNLRLQLDSLHHEESPFFVTKWQTLKKLEQLVVQQNQFLLRTSKLPNHVDYGASGKQVLREALNERILYKDKQGSVGNGQNVAGFDVLGEHRRIHFQVPLVESVFRAAQSRTASGMSPLYGGVGNSAWSGERATALQLVYRPDKGSVGEDQQAIEPGRGDRDQVIREPLDQAELVRITKRSVTTSLAHELFDRYFDVSEASERSRGNQTWQERAVVDVLGREFRFAEATPKLARNGQALLDSLVRHVLPAQGDASQQLGTHVFVERIDALTRVMQELTPERVEGIQPLRSETQVSKLEEVQVSKLEDAQGTASRLEQRASGNTTRLTFERQRPGSFVQLTNEFVERLQQEGLVSSQQVDTRQTSPVSPSELANSSQEALQHQPRQEGYANSSQELLHRAKQDSSPIDSQDDLQRERQEDLTHMVQEIVQRSSKQEDLTSAAQEVGQRLKLGSLANAVQEAMNRARQKDLTSTVQEVVRLTQQNTLTSAAQEVVQRTKQEDLTSAIKEVVHRTSQENTLNSFEVDSQRNRQFRQDHVPSSTQEILRRYKQGDLIDSTQEVLRRFREEGFVNLTQEVVRRLRKEGSVHTTQEMLRRLTREGFVNLPQEVLQRIREIGLENSPQEVLQRIREVGLVNLTQEVLQHTREAGFVESTQEELRRFRKEGFVLSPYEAFQGSRLHGSSIALSERLLLKHWLFYTSKFDGLQPIGPQVLLPNHAGNGQNVAGFDVLGEHRRIHFQVPLVESVFRAAQSRTASGMSPLYGGVGNSAWSGERATALQLVYRPDKGSVTPERVEDIQPLRSETQVSKLEDAQVSKLEDVQVSKLEDAQETVSRLEQLALGNATQRTFERQRPGSFVQLTNEFVERLRQERLLSSPQVDTHQTSPVSPSELANSSQEAHQPTQEGYADSSQELLHRTKQDGSPTDSQDKLQHERQEDLTHMVQEIVQRSSKQEDLTSAAQEVDQRLKFGSLANAVQEAVIRARQKDLTSTVQEVVRLTQQNDLTSAVQEVVQRTRQEDLTSTIKEVVHRTSQENTLSSFEVDSQRNRQFRQDHVPSSTQEILRRYKQGDLIDSTQEVLQRIREIGLENSPQEVLQRIREVGLVNLTHEVLQRTREAGFVDSTQEELRRFRKEGFVLSPQEAFQGSRLHGSSTALSERLLLKHWLFYTSKFDGLQPIGQQVLQVSSLSDGLKITAPWTLQSITLESTHFAWRPLQDTTKMVLEHLAQQHSLETVQEVLQQSIQQLLVRSVQPPNQADRDGRWERQRSNTTDFALRDVQHVEPIHSVYGHTLTRNLAEKTIVNRVGGLAGLLQIQLPSAYHIEVQTSDLNRTGGNELRVLLHNSSQWLPLERNSVERMLQVLRFEQSVVEKNHNVATPYEHFVRSVADSTRLAEVAILERVGGLVTLLQTRALPSSTFASDLFSAVPLLMHSSQLLQQSAGTTTFLNEINQVTNRIDQVFHQPGISMDAPVQQLQRVHRFQRLLQAVELLKSIGTSLAVVPGQAARQVVGNLISNTIHAISGQVLKTKVAPLTYQTLLTNQAGQASQVLINNIVQQTGQVLTASSQMQSAYHALQADGMQRTQASQANQEQFVNQILHTNQLRSEYPFLQTNQVQSANQVLQTNQVQSANQVLQTNQVQSAPQVLQTNQAQPALTATQNDRTQQTHEASQTLSTAQTVRRTSGLHIDQPFTVRASSANTTRNQLTTSQMQMLETARSNHTGGVQAVLAQNKPLVGTIDALINSMNPARPTSPTHLAAHDALQVPLRPARQKMSWQDDSTALEFLKRQKNAEEPKHESSTTPETQVILPPQVDKSALTAANMSPADLDRIVSKVYRELEEKLESEMKSRGF